MAHVETEYFGTIPYREDSIFEFPAGLPAFVNEKRFVPIESPQHSPLLFLQSLVRPSLCFLALPIQVVDRDYRLAVSREDLVTLGLTPDRQPELTSEVAVLALLSIHDGLLATANLMAPIIVNLKSHHALQAIRQDSLYSHQHPIHRVPSGQDGAARMEQPC
jgi:flagellar assembly factor FliW